MDHPAEPAAPSENEPIPIKVGIIGESGLDTPIYLENRKESLVCTPFGKPSDTVIEGEIGGVKVALLSRHGRLHDIMPSNINYRANIWAMRKLGCTHILVTHSCGSLRESMRPGDIVIAHDFIDCTTKRAQTFYDGRTGSPFGVCHIPMSPSFNNHTRRIIIDAAKELQVPIHLKGTIVSIEGPRYSSLAENRMYRNWGGDLVNMTLCPEVVLAKEAGILYASMALVTNYECWCINQSFATTQEIAQTFQRKVEKVQKLLIKTVMEIGKVNWSEDVLNSKLLVCNNFSNCSD